MYVVVTLESWIKFQNKAIHLLLIECKPSKLSILFTRTYLIYNPQNLGMAGR